MKNTNSKKGETLIEVMAALTCLVLAGISAVTVAIQVMSTTAVSKEYLVAQNLAREAIEGVINVRDTNWMNHPADKENCWMIKMSNGDCEDSDKINTEDHYIMMREENGQIILEPKGTARKLEILEGEMPVATEDGLFILYVDEYGLYTHTLPGTTADVFPDFYRMVTFEQLDPVDPDGMKINVLVQWMHKGSMPKRYELSSIITNYAN